METLRHSRTESGIWLRTSKLGVVVCSPSMHEAKAGRLRVKSQLGLHGDCLKKPELGWVQWLMPVIPATQ
jgi:hypothetical protein